MAINYDDFVRAFIRAHDLNREIKVDGESVSIEPKKDSGREPERFQCGSFSRCSNRWQSSIQ